MSSSATITSTPIASATSSTVSTSATSTRSQTNGLGMNNPPNMGGSGAGIWDGGVALALLVACLLTIGSRFMIRRRRQRQFHASERADASRRGEEGGLPTYGETTMASRGSTVPYPPTARTTMTGTGGDVNWSSISRPVPSDHPLYAPTAPRTRRTDLESGQNGDDGATTTLAPPEYDGPPKYA